MTTLRCRTATGGAAGTTGANVDRFTLNLTTDELEALRQLETSVDAGRSKVAAPLWAALTTVRGKLRKLDAIPEGCRQTVLEGGSWSCIVCGATGHPKPGWGFVPKYCSIKCRDKDQRER